MQRQTEWTDIPLPVSMPAPELIGLEPASIRFVQPVGQSHSGSISVYITLFTAELFSFDATSTPCQSTKWHEHDLNGDQALYCRPRGDWPLSSADYTPLAACTALKLAFSYSALMQSTKVVQVKVFSVILMHLSNEFTCSRQR